MSDDIRKETDMNPNVNRAARTMYDAKLGLCYEPLARILDAAGLLSHPLDVEARKLWKRYAAAWDANPDYYEHDSDCTGPITRNGLDLGRKLLAAEVPPLGMKVMFCGPGGDPTMPNIVWLNADQERLVRTILEMGSK